MKLMTELDDSLGLGNMLLDRGSACGASAGSRTRSPTFGPVRSATGRPATSSARRWRTTTSPRSSPSRSASIRPRSCCASRLVSRAANDLHGERPTTSGRALAVGRGDIGVGVELQSTASRRLPPPGGRGLRPRLARPSRRDPCPCRRQRRRLAAAERGQGSRPGAARTGLPSTLARLRAPGVDRRRPLSRKRRPVPASGAGHGGTRGRFRL